MRISYSACPCRLKAVAVALDKCPGESVRLRAEFRMQALWSESKDRPRRPSVRAFERALCSLAHDTPASEMSLTASAVLPREVALVCVLTDSPLLRTRWSDLYARGGYLSRIVDRIVAHAGAGADGSQPGTNVGPFLGPSPIVLAVAKHWTSLTRKLT